MWRSADDAPAADRLQRDSVPDRCAGAADVLATVAEGRPERAASCRANRPVRRDPCRTLERLGCGLRAWAEDAIRNERRGAGRGFLQPGVQPRLPYRYCAPTIPELHDCGDRGP